MQRIAGFAALLILLAVACKDKGKEPLEEGASRAAAENKEPPRPAAKEGVSDQEKLGRRAVEAIKTGDIGPLLEIPGDRSDMVRLEIEKTQELTSRDFPAVLREMDDANIDRSTLEFVRLEDSGLSGGPLGSGDLYFRASDGTVYTMLLNWTRGKGGPAVLGLSRWFKTSKSQKGVEDDE